ncbi:hypothetical protein CcaverHIS002_0505980 [Cutaneotrichosporon cavernicola]|uniref:RidA family protein n=1 Tax=Cutaneotrichosporon cavernicola TaxID=279322 RepID=A0AA48L6V6_9TREE|nr:uncharacterized protein CcaverHIS019_0506500 [Cutaneotrichosporon cavernicola]BEI85197.1 hypothetical protein CcaverHIS002_0505980 [Cutaneotrichosporon cavernicola]BEI93022.1 hypothetical protein CcaverHIS019_0506500 [Cutaneotrichosporon cavernicola]BEJ00799.1 hypothetical protein CcaverHIS631_0506560 [Cutaneotrichosporon cavernicola]BEJ08565.1 hypothetical protein CcaverHIS641_0506590 [Cutaneotrichosporon cavernicola]
MPEYTLTHDAPAPLPGIAVKAGGFLYTSGSVGMRPDGTMVSGTVQDRTRQVLANLRAVVEASGYTLGHTVKATCYLSDLERDFEAFNDVWKEVMPNPKPARTCIGVARLPAGGTDVEIELVLYKD